MRSFARKLRSQAALLSVRGVRAFEQCIGAKFCTFFCLKQNVRREWRETSIDLTQENSHAESETLHLNEEANEAIQSLLPRMSDGGADPVMLPWAVWRARADNREGPPTQCERRHVPCTSPGFWLLGVRYM